MKSSKIKTYNQILNEYIEPDELKSIIERVRRERQNKKDDIMLSQFYHNRKQSYNISQHVNDKPITDSVDTFKGKEIDHVSVDVEEKCWIEPRDSIKHKADIVSSTGSCLCSCSHNKRDSISLISEAVNIENHRHNPITPNNDITNHRVRSLGYSNITVVSSHRDSGNVNGDGSGVNTEKLKAVRLKIKRFLDVFLVSVEVFKSPEDEAEMVQLKKKAVEFCGRFSRNHLYEIGRALNETTKTLNYCLPYDQWKNITTQSKSILNVHQVLLQAFSMFQRHMRIVWGYGDTHEKLHTLLRLTLEVNRICFPQEDNTDLTYTDLKNGCNKLIEKLSNIFEDDNKSCASKSSLYYKEMTPGLTYRKMISTSTRVNKDISHAQRRPVKRSGLSNLNNTAGDRFSMYRQHLPKRMTQNRKVFENTRNQTNCNNMLTRKTKSSHGMVKHHHETNPRNINQKESKSSHQLCPKSLSGLFRNNQEVKEKKKAIPAHVKVHAASKKRSNGHMELVYPNSHLEALEECSSISDQLNNLENDYIVSENRQRHIENVSSESPVSNERRDANATLADGGASSKKTSTPSMKSSGEGTGEKNRDRSVESRNESNNVLLLVVKHTDSEENKHETKLDIDNKVINGENIRMNENIHLDFNKEMSALKESLIESPNKRVINTLKQPSPREMIEFDRNAKTEEVKILKVKLKAHETPKKQSTVEIENKLTKKLNLVIPKEIGEEIHNYRITFIKSLIDNPLYAHKSIKRPWEAVERISDKLIDEAIRTVSEEMEMEALLKQMVDVELKDFNTVTKIS